MKDINGKFAFLLKKKQFSFLKKIKEKFPKSNVFLVGGAVRDVLMEKTPYEHDFVISKIPFDDLNQFLSQIGYTDLVGKNFGVIKFRPKNQKHIYDIALPRTDHALKTGGYRDVHAQFDENLPIKDDLSRRDFTINAIAVQINKTAELIDPFKGQKDIQKKIIRTVGNPQERFEEDYSRTLRALRFACQLNFDINKETWKTLAQIMPRINDTRKNKERIVPHEIISKELLKSLSSNPVKTMDLWDASKAIKEIIPELLEMKDCPQPENLHSEGDVWAHTRLCFQMMMSEEFAREFSSPISANLLAAVLFHDIGKPFCLKTPEKDNVDRIRFDGHDTEGAKLFSRIAHRIKLSTVPNLYCDIEKTSWMIHHHLLLIHGSVENLKNTTIEKYFFNILVPGEDLLKLFWLDAKATIPKNDHDTMINYRKLKNRIKKLKECKKTTLPQPLINGKDIMRETGLKSGKKIGSLIEEVREEQLKGNIKTKKKAIEYIKNKSISK